MSNETTHWKFPQWSAAGGVVLLMLQVGFMCGWASPYLSYLVRPNPEFHISKDEASWVASLLNAGRFLGAFAGALAVHYGGSRRAVLWTFAPICLGWALILNAERVELLYLARVAGGLGMGMVFCCFPLYVGEVSLAQTRGSMIMMGFCGSASGIFLASVCGYYLSMRASSLCFLGPCLLGMLLFLLLPDSPHWLLKHDDEAGARRSVGWYRSGAGVDEELQAVQKFVTSVKSKSFADKLERFRKPPVRKALFIVLTLFALMQLSGLNTILFYMEIIFWTGHSQLIHPAEAVALVNLAGALTILLTINLMDRCGRRVLLLISGVGVMASMAALGAHFAMLDAGRDPKEIEWLPVASVFGFLIFYAFGLLTVPSTVLSELFPANVKCTAACLASLTGAACAFAVSKSFQPITDSVGEQYAFFGYAAVMLTIVPFVLFCMPETKGKSLQEIQEELAGDSG